MSKKWIIVFQDFSKTFNSYAGALEPEPPFLAQVEDDELNHDSSRRIEITYRLENNTCVTRRVNRACCSTLVFATEEAAIKAASKAKTLIGVELEKKPSTEVIVKKPLRLRIHPK